MKARGVALLAGLSIAPVLATAWAQDDVTGARMWQGPATAAAEAAASKSNTPSANTQAPSTPQPTAAAAKPAEAPAAPAGNVSPEKKAVDNTGAAKSPYPVAAPVLPPEPVPAKKPDSAKAPATAAAAPAEPAPGAASAVKDGAKDEAPDPAAETPTKNAKDAKGKKPPTPAKVLFGAVKVAAPLSARAIGWYAKGCLAGAKALPIDGPAWQVMRLSRNRMWGHPVLVSLVERLATESKEKDGWPGLLVGDLAQPRGGPMTSGHASHQVGLDADVWLTRAPDRRLSEKEREDISATSMLAADDISVDPKVFGEGQVKLIKRAASYRLVERVLVHPAIKKALCEAAGTDRSWLAKVRPYWGHYYHMHIRIGCPAGSSNCQSQPPPPGDDGCGAELKDWIKKVTPKKVVEKKPEPKNDKPVAKKKEITMADLPPECRTVLAAGEPKPDAPAVAEKKAAAKTAATKDAGKKAAAQ
jgi:penicillin-insensitive murein endopeptidase